MINKVIFLDIDGVLNSQLWYTTFRKNLPPEPTEVGEIDLFTIDPTITSNKIELFSQDIDPNTVNGLNNLVKQTAAGVVISSTWRLGRGTDELQEILDGAGFVGEVIGTTPDMRFGNHSDSILRGNEILAWIKANQGIVGTYYSDYRHYVILDDNSDMLYWQRNNFIKVDPYVGLTPSNVFQAKKILNS